MVFTVTLSTHKLICTFEFVISMLLYFIFHRFIAFQHAETIIHEFYGGVDYWKCRASMKFSPDLISIANNFIKDSLISFSIEEVVNGLSLEILNFPSYNM